VSWQFFVELPDILEVTFQEFFEYIDGLFLATFAEWKKIGDCYSLETRVIDRQNVILRIQPQAWEDDQFLAIRFKQRKVIRYFGKWERWEPVVVYIEAPDIRIADSKLVCYLEVFTPEEFDPQWDLWPSPQTPQPQYELLEALLNKPLFL